MIDGKAERAGTGDRPPRTRVELRSDTFTLPSAQMLQAMVSAEVGDDVYAEDPTVADLERLAATILSKQAACFMPSGTMCNLVAILSHCARGSKVIVGEESDIYVWEAGGASACGGVMYHPVPHRADGGLDLDAVLAAFPADPSDPQFALPGLLCLENPQNQCGGKVLPMSYLRSVSDLARTRGIPVHLDGARIFNAALSSGVAVQEIAAQADSVQFCLSKGLGAPVGSMLVGTSEFIDRARRLRKMLGGGMRQSGVLAAAGIVALQNRERLIEDHQTARRLADGLGEIAGLIVDTPEPEINMVFFRTSAPGLDNSALIAAARSRGVTMAELRRGQIRLVTHCDISAEDIDYTLTIIRSILGEHLSSQEAARRSHDHHNPVLAR